jgi:hypothetical protein
MFHRLSLVGLFVAPIFILIIIGVVYHLSVFVATERQTTMAELMAAQMVTITPRVLSTLVSFFTLYFPGFLVCSILLTQILFTRTSDILFLLLTLLAGASLTVSSHFVASFFSKAPLAGLYTSVLVFALALVILAETLAYNPSQTQVMALAAVFPPITWATLISDVATREYNLHGFSLAPVNKTPSTHANAFYNNPAWIQAMDGYLYVVFFILQIIVYGIATYLVEQQLWGVARHYARIEASSDVALRCTSLSKTFYGKRPWYWPFKVKGSTVLAVDNLDLEVKKGSVTFMLGPNGGGKTTSLKCIAGMISMDNGSRLELNESGEIFGICPQHNVGCHPSCITILLTCERSFGAISLFKSISRSGVGSRLLLSRTRPLMKTMSSPNVTSRKRPTPQQKPCLEAKCANFNSLFLLSVDLRFVV